LLLHVGTHKTATSSLQSAFSRASADLARRGTLYPETGRIGAGHHNIAWGLVGDDRFDSDAGYLDELAEEIRRHHPPRVLLSSEDFEYHNDRKDRLLLLRRWIHRLGYEPVVIIALRDVPSYIESLYSELVAHGLTQGFDDFVRDALANRRVVIRALWDFRLDYEALVAGFAGVFGRRSIAVIPYDPRDMISRFRDSFPQILGDRDGEGELHTDLHMNVRRSNEEVLRLLALNCGVQQPPGGDRPSTIGLSAGSSVVEGFRLGAAQRERVNATFGDQVERLLKRYPPKRK